MFRKIKNDKQGNAIFSCNRHISVNSDGKTIYVADFDKGLIVLDLEGNYKTTITDPYFVYLCGVCTDKRGNIFVCGSGCQNLSRSMRRLMINWEPLEMFLKVCLQALIWNIIDWWLQIGLVIW
jgi:hypothetical protein